MPEVETDLPNVQQLVPIALNYEGMLPSRPNSIIETNIFGDIWTPKKSVRSSYISSKGQIPGFHALGFVQGLEVELDEHRKTTSMFQQALEYNTQMTNILFRLSNLEIRNKQIIEIKDKYVQNLRALEKEQKFRTKLHKKQDENNEVLVELQIARQNINSMEKHNKDMEMIRVERDSLQATLMQTNANCWKLKSKKDSLSQNIINFRKITRIWSGLS